MCVQVIVDPVRKGITEFPQPWRTFLIGFHGLFPGHKQAGPQVAVEGFLPLHFGQPADSPDIILLHPVKVVLALGVEHAKDRIGIRLSVNMGYPEIIPDNGHPGGLFLPTKYFRVILGLSTSPKHGQQACQQDFFHRETLFGPGRYGNSHTGIASPLYAGTPPNTLMYWAPGFSHGLGQNPLKNTQRTGFQEVQWY